MRRIGDQSQGLRLPGYVAKNMETEQCLSHDRQLLKTSLTNLKFNLYQAV